jgi:predicted GH43/DUF377 family glycosyl hydrolase
MTATSRLIAVPSQSAEPFAVTRLGVLMAPEEDNPLEAEGVLNPAAARGRDGELYLFPRLVAKGNYSRIGIARVRFNDDGDPVGVERLGIALEPAEPYEKRPDGGGVEDPRISYLPSVQRYIMTYTAWSPNGPRIAMAVSRDLFTWERLGLVHFEAGQIDFNRVDNKDAVLFPASVPDPEGVPSLALIHRPLFPGTKPEEIWAEARREIPSDAGPVDTGPVIASVQGPGARRRRLRHESIWLSYCRQPLDRFDICRFGRHYRLLSPRASWERIKVGIGAPPVLTRHGWLVIYHGVGGRLDRTKVHYSAGAMVLDPQHPEQIRYRSRHPILAPGADEREGTVPDVVFPTGVDPRTDLGQPDRIDVYFGMADARIGVGVLRVPEVLPETVERSRPGHGAESAA